MCGIAGFVGEGTAADLKAMADAIIHRGPDGEGFFADQHVAVLDVRGAAEWEAGHIPGARHIPLGDLPGRLADVPRGRPIIVHCQGGGRSAIAASLLRANAFPQVLNLAGGFSEWQAAGHPVERATGEHAGAAR